MQPGVTKAWFEWVRMFSVHINQHSTHMICSSVTLKVLFIFLSHFIMYIHLQRSGAQMQHDGLIHSDRNPAKEQHSSSKKSGRRFWSLYSLFFVSTVQYQEILCLGVWIKTKTTTCSSWRNVSYTPVHWFENGACTSKYSVLSISADGNVVYTVWTLTVTWMAFGRCIGCMYIIL
jgi:hypothetical protein